MDKVIPVVVIKDEKDTVFTLKALKDGGINCAEITFRTACAAEAIAIGVKEFPDMNIGAGTVINLEQAQKAVDDSKKKRVAGIFGSAFSFFAKRNLCFY